MAHPQDAVATLPLRRIAPALSGLAVWPVTDPAPPRTLVDILDATVRRYPDVPALEAGGTVLSYRELREAAVTLAATLRGHGIGPGDRVGVRVPSGTADLYVAILAVLYAGAAYVPVDVDDPAERAELIWQDAAVAAIVGENRRILRGPGTPGRRTHPVSVHDDAWIIFTSGTTGRPKGVAVSHRSAAAFVDAESRLFLRQDPLRPGDRVLAGLSVAFDASCEEMWLAWRHGACLVPAPRSLVKAGTDLGPWLVRRGITVVSTVPTLAALWPAEALERVRLLIVGGEACPPELVERLDAPGREFWNTYGPTETTVVACASLMRAGRPVRIGAPLDGWELAVVGPTGHPVAWGEVGELVIGGVGAARYLDPAKDAEKFAPHPALGRQRAYRSGDLVRAELDGLVFVGRADEQVKLGGRRIELGEIDAALQALPGVRAAAAAVKESAAGGQVLVGYLVPAAASGDAGNGGHGNGHGAAGPLGSLPHPRAAHGAGPAAPAFDREAAREQLLQRLPAALVPVLAFVDELPTRTSGKVDRNALPWPLPGQERAGEGTAAALGGTLGWLAGQWQRLLGVPVDPDSDFFALGGTSLTAARLIAALRERHPSVAVTDLYHHSRLPDLAAFLDDTARKTSARPDAAATAPPREVRRLPRAAGLYQAVVLGLLFVLTAVPWLLGVAAVDNLIGPLPWAPHTSWWVIAGAWLALASTPGRVVACGLGARLFTFGLRPGTYRRGGWTHLRLWTAERVVGTFSLASVAGTPLAPRYARLLGCRVGRDVHLHALPPVTGLAEFGDGCVLEPEVDAAGWWIEGDRLHVGGIRVAAGATVRTRSMLMPGTQIGAGAEIGPGSCVLGGVPVPPGERWHGTPARRDENPGPAFRWPAPHHRRSRRWSLAYALSLPLLQLLPLLSAAPALFVLYDLLGRRPGYRHVVDLVLATSVPLTVISMICYALLIVVVVRLASRAVKPGLHPAHGRVAWCVWIIHQLMDAARSALFPLYAGLLTPDWLRLLGARIGRGVEASTVLGLPSLIDVEDHAFLADDTLLAPFELRGGWLRLGRSRVGRRSFVGNSGIVGPGRELPDGSLVGVLSDAPPRATVGSSWLGRPGIPVQRQAEGGESTARTYDPPKHLLWARAGVETCRLLPVLLSVLLGDAVALGVQAAFERFGLLGTVPVAMGLLLGCGLAACLLTTLAKWLLIGRFRATQRPLWSSFVWRNELFDSFVEELAMPWLGSSLIGTPFLNVWLRSLGARIGRGVWCESHWLPETDLVSLADGASVNRGVVVQTHLFHDRLMRMDTVTLGRGATLGPHSIALLGAELGDAAVVGPSSLVMRGDTLPAGSRWLGNPVARWESPAEPKRTLTAPSTALAGTLVLPRRRHAKP
jgi:non-ribosomal peptide synthetase-like protein